MEIPRPRFEHVQISKVLAQVEKLLCDQPSPELAEVRRHLLHDLMDGAERELEADASLVEIAQ